MELDHISVTLNEAPDKYKIRAEIRGIPGKQWQDGLKFVWLNSPYYLCRKCELVMNGNEIELVLDDSSDIQNAIDALSSSISRAEKIVRNYGVANISNYKKAIN
ncbi:MAG: hypothetical protein GXZ01_09810 [Clostridiaceae bacterium]|nr:hypothetical protein [Clostridiaceae bacterium]